MKLRLSERLFEVPRANTFRSSLYIRERDWCHNDEQHVRIHLRKLLDQAAPNVYVGRLSIRCVCPTALPAMPVEQVSAEALVSARTPEGRCPPCFVPIRGICVKTIKCCEYARIRVPKIIDVLIEVGF